MQLARVLPEFYLQLSVRKPQLKMWIMARHQLFHREQRRGGLAGVMDTSPR